jgi:hypothetical protein
MSGNQQKTINSGKPKKVISLHQVDPAAKLHKPKPAELAQDAGGGYNPHGTFPQR